MEIKQSELPDRFIAKSPTTLNEMVLGEHRYVHVRHLTVDSMKRCWIKPSVNAYRNPLANWRGTYLRVQSIHDGYIVDLYGSHKWVIGGSGEMYEQRGYAKVELGDGWDE